MAKKYLSLEEAASQLGISTDQLKRYREQGEIRGFADRGSWKFRDQDIEEFLRSRQTDSSPDFPIIKGDSGTDYLSSESDDAEAVEELDFDSSLFEDEDDDSESDIPVILSDSSPSTPDGPGKIELDNSDSDVRLAFDESIFEDDSAEEVAASGSDVKLTGDSGPKLEADDDMVLDFGGWDSNAMLSDSDSDVKLIGKGTEAEVDLAATGAIAADDDDNYLIGDSDLNLSDSDSDVRLTEDLTGTAHEITFTGSDSDSDVKLMGSDDLLVEDSDSDVKLSAGLDHTDSDIRLVMPGEEAERTIAFPAIPDDSDLKLINKGSAARNADIDSGISLDVRGSGLGLDADESGISLEIDSGISLDADDSGISLESFDSGAKLGDDSGISLESFDGGDDSGITLDAGDSGISLDLADDSGISLEDDDMGRTMPMTAIPGAKAALSDSSAMKTQFEMPTQSVGRDSEFELAGLDDDDDDMGTNTSVLTFEDDEEDDAKTVAVPVKPAAKKAPAAAKKQAVVEDDFDNEVEDSFDDEESFDDDEFADGDDEDVHDAEDFDDEDFEAGQSQVAGFNAGARAARPDVDWGVGVKTLIGLSTVVSILCAVMGIELIRTMWLWTQPGSESTPSAVLQMVGGLF